MRSVDTIDGYLAGQSSCCAVPFNSFCVTGQCAKSRWSLQMSNIKRESIKLFFKGSFFYNHTDRIRLWFSRNSKFRFQVFFFCKSSSCLANSIYPTTRCLCPPLSPSLTRMILSVMGVISLSISPSVPTISTRSPAPALHLVCVFSLSLVWFDFTLFLSLLCPLYHVFSLLSHQRPEGLVWHHS